RTILYEENIAPRRIRLHQQVAKALEEVYPNRLQEHAAELAEHFSYSTEPADLTKAVDYGEMAAQRATDVYEFGEAVRLIQQALKVQEVLDPEDKAKRCDLLLKAGRALISSGQGRKAVDTEITEAFSLAEEIGDDTRMARASNDAMRAISAADTVTGLAKSEGVIWMERADKYAQPETNERGWADYFISIIQFARNPSFGIEYSLSRARAQALKDEDYELFGASGLMSTSMLMPWSDKELALKTAEEIEVQAGKTQNGLHNLRILYLMYGKWKKAENLGKELDERAARTGQVNQLVQVMGRNSTWAYLEGRLDDSRKILEDMAAYGREVGLEEVASHAILFNGLRTALCLGVYKEQPENEIWMILLREMDKPIHRRIPTVQAHLGEIEKVNDTLEWILNRRPDITTTKDKGMFYLDILYLEAAVLTNHRKATELLLKRFENSQIIFNPSMVSCVDRHLGGATALLERYDEARDYYLKAIKACSEVNFRPELALSRLEFAELLLDRYPDEKADAIEHLDFAIKEFREMKMQPSLERALRRKDILKA
ncbi:MAG TPA: hypothetical protein G4O15_06005, partial [Dehalococcoidia bacterium]|nr:hypothetical protein [Dehalococcoidia bacterium]